MFTLRHLVERFDLREATPRGDPEAPLKGTRVRIPGLELAGFPARPDGLPLLLLGMREREFLDRMDPALQHLRLAELFAVRPLGLILCDGQEPSTATSDPAAAAEAAGIPLYLSAQEAEPLWHAISGWLEEVASPVKSIPGTMMEVYGLGVLLLGEAGIGKSECALELVKRGHRLVSDDVVALRRVRGGGLVAFSDEIIRYHMEIRGVGIVDVRALFGIGAVLESKPVDVVIQLRKTRESSEFERIGLVQQHYRIFDISLPKLVIPVKVGRNISIQVEVAALNEKLKKHGMHSARNFLDALYGTLRGQADQPGRPAPGQA